MITAFRSAFGQAERRGEEAGAQAPHAPDVCTRRTRSAHARTHDHTQACMQDGSLGAEAAGAAVKLAVETAMTSRGADVADATEQALLGVAEYHIYHEAGSNPFIKVDLQRRRILMSKNINFARNKAALLPNAVARLHPAMHTLLYACVRPCVRCVCCGDGGVSSSCSPPTARACHPASLPRRCWTAWRACWWR